MHWVNVWTENTLSSADTKPKVRAQAKKSKCQSKTKTHVQLSQGRSDVNIAPVTTRRGYVLPPDMLRHELNIQDQVQERLRHLAENAIPGKPKIKSQRDGSMEVFVPHRVKWPHEFVLAGASQNKNRITYNQLSPIQWMAGFCRTIWEESDILTREHMLDYVINLLDDATDFSWASAKASHAILLCRMEQGEIAGWEETEKIDRVRRAHAQRHVVAQGSTHKAQDKGSNGGRVFPCVYFNKGACLQKTTPPPPPPKKKKKKKKPCISLCLF